MDTKWSCVKRGLLLSVLVVSLSSAPATAQMCTPIADGDVDGSTVVTPADARLTFIHFLQMASSTLTDCQRIRANVDPISSDITPADALCIFRRFLGLSSCLDRPFTLDQSRLDDTTQRLD